MTHIPVDLTEADFAEELLYTIPADHDRGKITEWDEIPLKLLHTHYKRGNFARLTTT